MAMLEELIRTGRIVDLMLIFVALEVAAMLAYRFRTGRGIAPLPMLLNVGAGGSLMLALKATLIGADWRWIAVCLIGALFFHTADLVQR